MDNRNYDIAEDKKSEYLFNEIKAGYNSQAFFTEDFTTANNAFTLTFCAVKNSRAQAKVTFTSLGTVKFSINGVPCEERSCSGNTETDLEFFVTKGDNVLSIDISGATNFSLSYVNICGYVKRKPSDSKIYAVNGTGKSLIAKFNAVKNVVDVYVYGGSASIICSDVTCKGVALSDLDQNQVVAAFLKSDKIELYLIDLRYDDIMDSAEIVVSGALRISGGANGTL